MNASDTPDPRPSKWSYPWLPDYTDLKGEGEGHETGRISPSRFSPSEFGYAEGARRNQTMDERCPNPVITSASTHAHTFGLPGTQSTHPNESSSKHCAFQRPLDGGHWAFGLGRTIRFPNHTLEYYLFWPETLI